MKVIELIEEMSNICEQLQRDGHKLRLVPTMGALHAGHGSLIGRARDQQSVNPASSKSLLPLRMEQQSKGQACPEIGSGDHSERYLTGNPFNSMALDANDPEARKGGSQPRSSPAANQPMNQSSSRDNSDARIVVIVSIFVNSKQFNNPTDYLNYPKTLHTDLELCKALQVDYVFLPSGEQMYPETEIMTTLLPPDNQLSNDLEGKSRPGHFAGMLTVVCKLFNIIRPQEAYFGEKDYQQILLVSKMTRDLNMRVKIVAVETVREHDFLPLSSRNVRLGARQRLIAPVMCQLLLDAKQTLEQMHLDQLDGDHDLETTLLASMLTTFAFNLNEDESQMVEVDYLALRCANDLSEINRDQSNERFDCQYGCAIHCDKHSFKARLLASITVGGVRLLDNIEVALRNKQQLKG